MAATTSIRFSARLLDELGTEASMVSYLLVDPAQTLTQVNTALATWLTDLDAITGGQITQAHVAIAPALPGGLKAAPVAGARVEQTGVLNLSSPANNKRFGQAVPSIADSVLHLGKIDLSNAAVQAFIALLTGGGVLGGGYTNQFTQLVTGFVDAIISFRKRRRQLQRSSFEV